jgi:WD40 repeat protein
MCDHRAVMGIPVEWIGTIGHQRRDSVNPVAEPSPFHLPVERPLRSTPLQVAGPARLGVLCTLAFSAFNLCAAAETNPAADHTAKAMALLRANCLSCHNAEKQKGGLSLAQREAALKGGDNGPAILPERASDSPLIKSLAAGADPHMPPKKQLADRQIATLRAWVEAGAVWDEKVLHASTEIAIPTDFGPLPDSYQPALALALSPDEKTLAIGRGGRIYLHDASQKELPLLKELAAHRDAVQSLAWSGDGLRLASGGFRQVVLWDTRTWEQALTLTNELHGRVTALAFTRDHQELLTADSVAAESGWIRQFKLGDGSQIAGWQAHGDSILALDVSTDGKLLATAGADRLGRLWELESRKELKRFERHEGHLLAIAFNPDASWVATGATDKLMKIWDVKTGQEIINIKNHSAAVTALRWADEGKLLVSVCEDGTPRRFNEFKAHSGRESSDGARERKLDGAEEILHALAVSRDGQTIFGAGDDGVVRVWDKDGKLRLKLSPPKVEVAAKEAKP